MHQIQDLSDLRQMGFECEDWIHLVQDGGQWRCLSVSTGRLSVSQKDVYSVELRSNFLIFHRAFRRREFVHDLIFVNYDI
jgi:hypothetical protein